MTETLTVTLTRNEASAALDVLLEIAGIDTADEMRDRFGWNQRDITAWRNAARKIDRALSVEAAA